MSTETEILKGYLQAVKLVGSSQQYKVIEASDDFQDQTDVRLRNVIADLTEIVGTMENIDKLIETREIGGNYNEHSSEFQDAFHQATGGWL